MSKNQNHTLFHRYISRRDVLKGGIQGAALIALGSSAALSNFTRAQNTDLTGTLTIWAWPGADEPLRQTIPGFNEKYPNVNVEIETVGFGDVHTRLLTALSAGTGAPDISGVEDRRVLKFGATGTLENLSEQFEPYKDSIMQFKADFNTDAEGNLWGIPWDASPTGVFYHTGVFDTYGISPSDIETWDGYIEAGQSIVDQSNGDVKMLPMMPENSRYLYETIALQLGAGLFKEDLTPNILSDEFRTACEITKRMFDTGINAPIEFYNKASYDAYNNATIATTPHAVWFGGFIRNNASDQAGNWSVTRWPSVTEGGNYGTQGQDFGSALVIPSQSKNKEAARAFLEYAQLTAEGQLIQYEKGDLFPSMVTPEVLGNPVFDQPDEYFHNDPIRRIFADSNKQMTLSMAVHPDYSEAQDITQRHLAEAFKGNISIEVALEDAVKEIRVKLRIR